MIFGFCIEESETSDILYLGVSCVIKGGRWLVRKLRIYVLNPTLSASAKEALFEPVKIVHLLLRVTRFPATVYGGRSIQPNNGYPNQETRQTNKPWGRQPRKERLVGCRLRSHNSGFRLKVHCCVKAFLKFVATLLAVKKLKF